MSRAYDVQLSGNTLRAWSVVMFCAIFARSTRTSAGSAAMLIGLVIGSGERSSPRAALGSASYRRKTSTSAIIGGRRGMRCSSTRRSRFEPKRLAFGAVQRHTTGHVRLAQSNIGYELGGQIFIIAYLSGSSAIMERISLWFPGIGRWRSTGRFIGRSSRSSSLA
jgi:hypothetical protein